MNGTIVSMQTDFSKWHQEEQQMLKGPQQLCPLMNIWSRYSLLSLLLFLSVYLFYSVLSHPDSIRTTFPPGLLSSLSSFILWFFLCQTPTSEGFLIPLMDDAAPHWGPQSEQGGGGWRAISKPIRLIAIAGCCYMTLQLSAAEQQKESKPLQDAAPGGSLLQQYRKTLLVSKRQDVKCISLEWSHVGPNWLIERTLDEIHCCLLNAASFYHLSASWQMVRRWPKPLFICIWNKKAENAGIWGNKQESVLLHYSQFICFVVGRFSENRAPKITSLKMADEGCPKCGPGTICGPWTLFFFFFWLPTAVQTLTK